MSLSTPTPPLLLTKRLTSFLRSNLSPQVHTTIITTVSGKLLSHAGQEPVSTLRTQCTVAASVWAIYASSATGVIVNDALPSRGGRDGGAKEGKTAAVTIQLSGGVLVVRQLRCGLLFVCVGHASNDSTTAPGDSQPLAQATRTGQTAQTLQPPQQAGGAENRLSPPIGSPSEVESVISAAPTTTSIATTASTNAGAVAHMRRQTEELAKWLDDKLGSLAIPDDGVGTEMR